MSWDQSAPPEPLVRKHIRAPDWRIPHVVLHDSVSVLTCQMSSERIAIISSLCAIQTTGTESPLGPGTRSEEVLLVTTSLIPECVYPMMDVAGAQSELVQTKRLQEPFDLERDLIRLREFLKSGDGLHVGLIIIDGFSCSTGTRALTTAIGRTKVICRELAVSVLLVTEPASTKTNDPFKRLPAAALHIDTALAVLFPDGAMSGAGTIYSLCSSSLADLHIRKTAFRMKEETTSSGTCAPKVVWTPVSERLPRGDYDARNKVQERIMASLSTGSKTIDDLVRDAGSKRTVERNLADLKLRELVENGPERISDGNGGESREYRWRTLHRVSVQEVCIRKSFAKGELLGPAVRTGHPPRHAVEEEELPPSSVDAESESSCAPTVEVRGGPGEPGEPGEPGGPGEGGEVRAGTLDTILPEALQDFSSLCKDLYESGWKPDHFDEEPLPSEAIRELDRIEAIIKKAIDESRFLIKRSEFNLYANELRKLHWLIQA